MIIRLVMALPGNQSKGTYRQSPMGPVGVSVNQDHFLDHVIMLIGMMMITKS